MQANSIHVPFICQSCKKTCFFPPGKASKRKYCSRRCSYVDWEERIRNASSASPNENGCILWTQSVNGSGYGIMRVNGIYMRAHRLSYIVNVGSIPSDLCVLHRCDIRACINPDHLFLGTRTENTVDMMSKGREPHGEKSGTAKLTSENVKEIRQRFANGERKSTIAKGYGISPRSVRDVINGITWKHV